MHQLGVNGMNAPQNKKIAFVIVGWNNRNILKDCLESVEKQTYQNSLTIYVDNNSSDSSTDFVKEHFPKTIVLEQKSNTGFTKGNNIGISEALNDPAVGYIALLNSDARLAPDWAEIIVKFAEQKPNGAMFQGTNLDYFDHSIIDSTHIYVSHNGQGTQGNWRYYVTTEKGPKKVFGVNAAACLISRKFIEAQPFGKQFFDESFFMYLEDIDIVCRATIMGWDNYLVRGARAHHMGSASSGKNPGFSLYMTFRNNTAVLVKNFPAQILIRMLPKIIRGDMDTLRTLWKRNQKKAMRKVIWGRLVGIFRSPLYIYKRLKLNPYRKKLDKDYLWILMRRGY